MWKKVLGIMVSMLLLTGCSNRYVDTKLSSTAHIPGEDHQSWNRFGSVSANCFTRAEGGYYYVNEQTDLLTYYDCAAGMALPLCNQPGCEHDSEDCSAYISFYLDYLQYYHGYLYALGADWEAPNDLCVYRISADGATRENIGTVLSPEGGAAYRCLIHRGYVYCAPYGGGMTQSGVNVYRFPLSGKGETELIYTAEAKAGGTMMLNAQGNYLYLHYSHFADSKGTSYTGELYRYQIHEGEIEPVLEGIYRDFAVDGEQLYYDNGKQIMAYHMDTGEETVLAEPGMPVYLSCAEGYLCYDNGCGLFISKEGYDNRTVTVIDTESGAVLGSIPLEGEHSEFTGTDGENLIAQTVKKTDDGYDISFTACSLKDLETQDPAWKRLE